jgi:hypothetical protein
MMLLSILSVQVIICYKDWFLKSQTIYNNTEIDASFKNMFTFKIVLFFALREQLPPTNLSSTSHRVSENTVSSVDIVNLPTYGSACLPLSKSSQQFAKCV